MHDIIIFFIFAQRWHLHAYMHAWLYFTHFTKAVWWECWLLQLLLSPHSEHSEIHGSRTELMDGDTIMCGWLLIDFVGNRMDAFAQRPKKKHGWALKHHNIPRSAEKPPCLAVRSEELCDHGTGARVGHLEVMHLPSFFFPFSSLHCWPRLLPGRVLMAPTSNTYIRQEALLGAVNKMQHYLHCSSYDLFPWNISRHYILMNMHAIVWTYKNDTNNLVKNVFKIESVATFSNP